MEIADLGERRKRLGALCADDADLLAKAEAILSSQQDAENFFGECTRAIDDLRAPLHPEVTTRGYKQFGAYRIVRKIGEGGCGAVYQAEQLTPIRRNVALKIIKLGMDTRSVISRFEAERQSLALMDHPNIARVLDAGASDLGCPYFVMELVDGVRITDHCDARTLGLRQRLALFIQVCHAIQHAHQKGVIHRDIKPSNILVTTQDGTSAPKVIDFGIAKAIQEHPGEATGPTVSGLFIGTPVYMSPEQTLTDGRRADTRSDIYSLGVLFYELLTGTTPFSREALLASGIEGMRRMLNDDDPPRPSVRLQNLPLEALSLAAKRRQIDPEKLRLTLIGDLDWIAIKATERDRERRYQTVNDLTLDVQRFLAQEPVLARPPSRVYQFQKLVRRNKAAFIATGAVMLALITGTGVSTWLWIKEREARVRMLEAESEKSELQAKTAHLEKLRQHAEDRRMFAEASALSKAGKFDLAGNLLDQIPQFGMGEDAATVYREVGNWDAKNGHSGKALNRFSTLFEINHAQSPADPMVTTLDDYRLAVILADQGETARYREFCDTVLASYPAISDPRIAARMIRSCLLLPASKSLLDRLQPLVDTIRNELASDTSTLTAPAKAWCAYSMVFMAYRSGDDVAASSWCQKAMSYDDYLLIRDAGIELVRVMALARKGDMESARRELSVLANTLEREANGLFPPRPGWQGYWFDRTVLRILAREATGLILASPEKDFGASSVRRE